MYVHVRGGLLLETSLTSPLPAFFGMLCSRKIDVANTQVWGLLADLLGDAQTKNPKNSESVDVRPVLRSDI